MAPDCPCEIENGVPQGLTCIHSRIHCVATQDQGDGEIDKIDIANFIRTIADVALEIARREHLGHDESSGLHQGQ